MTRLKKSPDQTNSGMDIPDAAIERIAGYYMITCMEQCPESGRNSAHTRSCRAAGFAAFEHGNFFFNLRIGRIAKTGINVARFF